LRGTFSETTDKEKQMISTRIYIDAESATYCKTIDVPFPLVPGMQIIVGEPSDLNHLEIETACWETSESVLVCWSNWVSLRESLSDKQVHDWLVKDGWTADKS